MVKIPNKKSKSNSNNGHLNRNEEPTFEQKKREAYSAMGRLGGIARAKQMAEKGFSKVDEPKNHSKKPTKNIEKDGK